MLTNQKHALVLLLEPLLWGCFFVVTAVLEDTRESFASHVWTPVLAIGLMSLRLAPDLTRLYNESARVSALDAAWHGVIGIMKDVDTTNNCYQLHSVKEQIRFFMDVKE